MDTWPINNSKRRAVSEQSIVLKLLCGVLFLGRKKYQHRTDVIEREVEMKRMGNGQ